MNKNFVFGMGTGRCGTHSLQKLLDSQPNSNFSHEFGDRPVGNWEYLMSSASYMLKSLISRSHNSKNIGDVAFYHLSYVDYFNRTLPNCKFIVLKRDKQETIESYMKKTSGRNHWIDHDGDQYKNDAWDKCFPTYDVESKKEAIAKYYDDYYKKCKKIENAEIFPMNYLNSESGVKDILNFAEIDNPKIITNIKKDESNT